jgi:oxygen-independent coproporphyrinogen-3 oxidase
MSDFGIYVHWPYCSAICPYCDFNVYRARGADNEPLLAAIEADLAAHAARFGRREAASVFFGGGTPSLLRGDEIARLIAAASRSFGLARNCEITLEANPEDGVRFGELAAAGVTRFSIGAQALDDAALKALGRKHDKAAVLGAVAAAAATGQRLSLDLIYAREGQSLDAWRRELAQALTLPLEHVSLYQLTIEPGTAFARRLERHQLVPPDQEAAAALYEATQEVAAAAGFPAYEISNHARGENARARHNMIYWQGGDWIGLGPGAHGRIMHGGARIATEAQRRPSDYIDAVNEHGVGWINEATLTGRQAADELLLMGLRVKEGIERRRFADLAGRELNGEALHWLKQQELIDFDAARVWLRPRGRILANSIVAELSFASG